MLLYHSHVCRGLSRERAGCCFRGKRPRQQHALAPASAPAMRSSSMRSLLRCFNVLHDRGVAAAAAAAAAQRAYLLPFGPSTTEGFHSTASASEAATPGPTPIPTPAPQAASAAAAGTTLQSLALDLSTHFKDDAATTSRHIAATLSPAQRVSLFAALREHTKPEQLNDAYVEELYQSASGEGPITKRKFRDVMLAHVHLHDQRDDGPPSRHALWMVFIASAIPFVAFGFLDNFIMLTVGEEIDAAFGARLGLTTLASAGLGNLVADVVGVSAAKVIEQGVRALPFIQAPRLTSAQKKSSSVRVSVTSGSLAGVMLGCCLGLLPLAIGGHFFRPH